MLAFIADKESWPLPPDIQYLDQGLVLEPSLLSAALAFGRPQDLNKTFYKAFYASRPWGHSGMLQ